jgi:DNA-directed RNA polymerase specialized sigma24 family protein
MILGKLLEALELELSPALSDTFRERFMKQREPADIARELGCSTSVLHLRVWKIRRRAKKVLAKILERSERVDEKAPVVRWLRSFLAGAKGD